MTGWIFVVLRRNIHSYFHVINFLILFMFLTGGTDGGDARSLSRHITSTLRSQASWNIFGHYSRAASLQKMTHFRKSHLTSTQHPDPSHFHSVPWHTSLPLTTLTHLTSTNHPNPPYFHLVDHELLSVEYFKTPELFGRLSYGKFLRVIWWFVMAIGGTSDIPPSRPKSKPNGLWSWRHSNPWMLPSSKNQLQRT